MLVVEVGLSVNLASLTIDQVRRTVYVCCRIPTPHPSPRHATQHNSSVASRRSSLTIGQVLSKRRKVVVDMCEQIRIRWAGARCSCPTMAVAARAVHLMIVFILPPPSRLRPPPPPGNGGGGGKSSTTARPTPPAALAKSSTICRPTPPAPQQHCKYESRCRSTGSVKEIGPPPLQVRNRGCRLYGP